MSYRSNAARYMAATRQTKVYDVTLANGDTGRIAGADDRDARVEAERWAKVRKSTVATIQLRAS